MQEMHKSQVSRFRGFAMMANGKGAGAIGAFAIGAVAIGRLAIRRMEVEKAKFKSFEIQDSERDTAARGRRTLRA
jgi:hypothetical protein